jgi:hypothetical protein
VYTPDTIRSLFADLQAEASLLLLFLKFVQRIELLELPPGAREPRLLFSCDISHPSPELLAQRALFTTAAAAPVEQRLGSTYRVELCLRWAGSGWRWHACCWPSNVRGTADSGSRCTPLSRARAQQG